MSLFDAQIPEVEQVLPCDGTAVLHRRALAAAAAAAHCAELLATVPWQSSTLVMYGREVAQPRLDVWFGDPGAVYRYSGMRREPVPWTPRLLHLRKLCEDLAGCTFNSCLANLYRDGNDSVAWHSDDEPELGAEPVIASLSLGAVRRFDLRHKQTSEQVQVELPSGSVLVMSGRSQSHWQHRIAKTRKVTASRINLTFRTIVPVAR